MPNWISGSLKVRGTYENVEKFVKNGLNLYDHSIHRNNRPLEKITWLKDLGGEFYISTTKNEWLYVEGTQRAFIETEHVYTYEDHEDDGKYILICKVNQAWGFTIEDWVEISIKYNVDIRVWGLECGLEFGHEFEIIKGEITMDKDLEYSDWNWEAPIPWLGG